jgi:hypothetical protein
MKTNMYTYSKSKKEGTRHRANAYYGTLFFNQNIFLGIKKETRYIHLVSLYFSITEIMFINAQFSVYFCGILEEI